MAGIRDRVNGVTGNDGGQGKAAAGTAPAMDDGTILGKAKLLGEALAVVLAVSALIGLCLWLLIACAPSIKPFADKVLALADAAAALGR